VIKTRLFFFSQLIGKEEGKNRVLHLSLPDGIPFKVTLDNGQEVLFTQGNIRVYKIIIKTIKETVRFDDHISNKRLCLYKRDRYIGDIVKCG
jgi:hypothetical protein